jgi:hypothetical protein
MLHILFNLRIVDFSSDETFRVEYRVLRVGGECVFSGVTDSVSDEEGGMLA